MGVTACGTRRGESGHSELGRIPVLQDVVRVEFDRNMSLQGGGSNWRNAS